MHCTLQHCRCASRQILHSIAKLADSMLQEMISDTHEAQIADILKTKASAGHVEAAAGTDIANIRITTEFQENVDTAQLNNAFPQAELYPQEVLIHMSL